MKTNAKAIALDLRKVVIMVKILALSLLTAMVLNQARGH
jgi:hypothetical protein